MVNTECISHGLTVIHTVPNTASTGRPTRAMGGVGHAYSDIEWILITTPDYFLLDMVCWQEHNQTQSTSTDIDIYWYQHLLISTQTNYREVKQKGSLIRQYMSVWPTYRGGGWRLICRVIVAHCKTASQYSIICDSLIVEFLLMIHIK